MYRSVALAAVLSLVTMSFTGAAQAVDWPTRAVTIVAPAAAGGNLDITARLIASQLQEQTGQPFVVENKVGSGGTIGARIVSDAAPDGYTLVLHGDSLVAADKAEEGINFNVVEDLSPITEVTSIPYILVVSNNLPANNLEEFVAYAKEHGGGLKYGLANRTASSALGWDQFLKEAGISEKPTQVIYRGNAPAVTATMSGEVDFALGSYITVGGAIEGKQLKALGVGSLKPVAELPGVPTLGSVINNPDFNLVTWSGIWGPKNLPADLALTIRNAIEKALTTPSLIEKFSKQGAQIIVSDSPEQFGEFVKASRESTIKSLQELQVGVFAK